MAKRLAPDKEAGMDLSFESAKGYRETKVVDDPQGRPVAREHLEGRRRQFRRPMGVELPLRRERLAQ